MLDQISHQRSRGEARISLTPTGIGTLSQTGSAKVLLPRCHGAAPEIVFLNSSGGLASGDRLDFSAALAPGRVATATTQTAERAYRAEGPRAECTVTLDLGAGARLDWLPQETILFEGAALHRRTRVNLRGDAQFLGIDMFVLGRIAMGETLRRVDLDDRREIRRDGRLVMMDPLRLTDQALGRADHDALLGGARAIGFLTLAGPGVETALPALRDALSHPAVRGAASARPGLVTLRCLAGDGWPLRQQMARLINRIRPGAQLPRVWQIQERS